MSYTHKKGNRVFFKCDNCGKPYSCTTKRYATVSTAFEKHCKECRKKSTKKS